MGEVDHISDPGTRDVYQELVDMVDRPTWRTLLIDTVRSSGMDPWDLDIGKLAGMFAEKIRAMKSSNLRVPANAILASSILLRFKSDNWVFFPNEEVEEEEEQTTTRERVDIPELPPIKRVTKRRVTLDDLIRAIEDVMEKEIRKRKKSTSAHILMDVNPMEVLRDSFFDAEQLDMMKKAIWINLLKKKDDLGLVLFSDLLSSKTRNELIKVFISLLHLQADGKIFMWQENFFDEIIIKVNDYGGE